MKSEIDKQKKVYMIGCGELEETCTTYDVKYNSKGIDIMKEGKYVCTYSQNDMQNFISIGFAVYCN